ncbi:class I adenylate-forming enzyme family protein [Streptomyces sp. ISL-11]|uniref:class I adenylate-forming enzyme family protein n=1 Tax=Streptomyces sp. ISL-11 TaxID=2819174 RepID=UPI001BE5F9E8|nr:class I adenylate-forming enzyme family protein [Streptomyces sp. ISL-11]MBT2383360.1 acyl--CoA ligase [Streptomyces sp. ISL-11]
MAPDLAPLLHGLLDTAAHDHPDRPAVSDRTTTVTYRELAAASRRVAAWLDGQGLTAGDRVVAVCPPSVPVAALVFGAVRHGLVFSVLHEQVRGSALDHVLGDCEPALLISDDAAARQAAGERGIPARTVGALAGAMTDGAESAGPARAPLTVDPVCLIYTSGTTSRPKAVVSTHQQVVFAARAIQERLGYRPDDVVYCPLPLSFDVGLYQLFLGACAGAHVHLGDAAQAGPLLVRNLARTDATVLPAVPAVAEGLARMLRRGTTALPRLRLLTSTGAAMPPEALATLRERLPDLRVQLMFGLTECKRIAIMPPDGDLARPGACGLPLAGTEVFTVDDKGGRLPPGELGEFVVRGPHVMAGYWRRPELTAERFLRDEGLFPQLRTGDYGWIDDDGYLYFDGRRDDIYKERGFRVSTTEVESAARRVAGVESAAVLAPTQERSAALAVVGDVRPEEVLVAMREEIEEFKIPRRCAVLPAFPLNGNGKVDRKALALLLASEALHG